MNTVGGNGEAGYAVRVAAHLLVTVAWKIVLHSTLVRLEAVTVTLAILRSATPKVTAAQAQQGVAYRQSQYSTNK